MVPPDAVARIRRALESGAEPTSDFDLNPDVQLPKNRKLRPAAVLLALLETAHGVQIFLTKRAPSLKHHPGQIAFPGGKIENTDDGLVQAALREAEEEIGLRRENVEVLGVLAEHETVTGFGVTPVVACVLRPFNPVPEPGEVAEVFTVPLDHVVNLGNFCVQSRNWQGKPRYYQTVPCGPYYIWGATARVLHALAQRLAT